MDTVEEKAIAKFEAQHAAIIDRAPTMPCIHGASIRYAGVDRGLVWVEYYVYNGNRRPEARAVGYAPASL